MLVQCEAVLKKHWDHSSELHNLLFFHLGWSSASCSHSPENNPPASTAQVFCFFVLMFIISQQQRAWSSLSSFSLNITFQLHVSSLSLSLPLLTLCFSLSLSVSFSVQYLWGLQEYCWQSMLGKNKMPALWEIVISVGKYSPWFPSMFCSSIISP